MDGETFIVQIAALQGGLDEEMRIDPAESLLRRSCYKKGSDPEFRQKVL